MDGCEMDECLYLKQFILQGKGYTRGVTKPQFERILHIASLSVTSEEMKVSTVHASIYMCVLLTLCCSHIRDTNK